MRVCCVKLLPIANLIITVCIVNSMRTVVERGSAQVCKQNSMANLTLNYEHKIHIYLVYASHKIMLKVNKGLPYTQLIPMLYREIICCEINKNQRIKQEEIMKEVRKVLGFSTVCNNLKTDYLLSIQQGKVDKSLLLQCFMKKSGKSRNIKNNQKSYESQQSNKCSSSKFNYEIYNCLAIGGFSKVYLCRSYDDGQFYAIKFIKKKRQKQEQIRSSVLNQMSISSSFNHPFLIKMKEGFQTPKFYCMVFQYCSGGELFYLLKRVKLMSEEKAKFYFIQVLLGIQHIHDKSVIYRDLKPQNILIDRYGNLKIVDFGLSKKVQSTKQKTFSYCGSAEYMAPEMILRSGHNTSIDFYSLGALLYELVTGLPPFYSKNQIQLHQNILMQQLCFPAHIQISADLKDFLSRLLQKDQKMRLGSYAGIKQIVCHPWMGKLKVQQIMQKNRKMVPFPPNLNQHNFDTDQLGQDEKQFTQQIYRQFYSKNINKQIKVYANQNATQIEHPYEKMLTNLVSQCVKNQLKQNNQLYNTQKQQAKPKKQVNHFVMIKNKQYYLHELEKENILSKTIDFNKATSTKRKNELQKLVNKIANKSLNKSQSKSKLNVSVDPYKKLLPYFNKNKVIKPQSKKTLTRANILKMKISTNQITNSDYSQQIFS